MTMILEKTKWGTDLTTCCVLAEALDSDVILIGDADTCLWTFEMHATEGASYLSTSAPLQELISVNLQSA